MSLTLEQALQEACERIQDPRGFVRAVLSGRRRNMQPDAERIDLRPVLVQGQRVLQIVSFDGRATTTRNASFEDAPIGALLGQGYANLLIEAVDETLTIRITKKGQPVMHRERAVRTQVLEHDRAKARLLDAADPFLMEVGISDAEGKVKASRQDKYMQVEEFLRLLWPALESAMDAGHIARANEAAPLSLVDLGCGHAYLTFGAHQFLRKAGLPLQVVGVDLREASRARNETIAAKLGIGASIAFRAESIAQATMTRADVVIALHACDTATDDALAWAVRNNAGLILAAPCCHHDLQSQLDQSPEPWALVTRYGLLKERFVDVLTDAIRCHVLRLLGYRVDAIEFVSGEHTPRNLMIRAVHTRAAPDPADIARYRALMTQWNIRPALAQRLEAPLARVLE